MERTGKISTFQFLALLSVSRLLSTLTFVPSFDFDAGTSDYIIATLLGAVMLWAVCIPAFIFIGRNEEGGLPTLSKKFPGVLKALYCAYLTFIEIFVLLRMRLFVSSVFFNSTGNFLFTVLTVAAVCYCASFSLEAVGRAGSVAFVLLCISLGIIFFALNSSLDVNSLSPVFYYGFSPVFKLSLGVLARSSEPVLVYLLAHRVSGNLKKGLKIWLPLITAGITLCGLFLVLTLSDSAFLQAFPFHAMAQLSSFEYIERLDAVFAGIWILSAFLKAVLYSLIIKETVLECLPGLKQRYFLPLFGAAVCTVLLLAEHSVLGTVLISSIKIREALFFIFVLLIPCLVLITARRKRRRTQ